VAPPFENRLGPSHHNAPETSALAALDNFPREATQRQKVLIALYRYGPLTLDEMANITGLIGNSVRPRRKRLEQDGMVEDSGERSTTNMGKPAVVWTLTDEGLRAAKELTDG
jgi:predicted ArsR family transcriptional regulator